MVEQLQFAFLSSLDFPGRVTLSAAEVAEKLGVTVQHILDLIEEGKIVALDVKGKSSARRCVRIPVECYRDYIVGALTTPYARARLLRDLPRSTLRELRRELDHLLSAA